MTLTREQIAGLRELLAKATPGPWCSYRANKYFHLRNEAGDYIMEAGFRGQVRSQADSALIAAMHEALPSLLDELDALRALRARVEAVIQAWRIDGSILPSQDFADELVRLLAVDAGEVG